MGTPGPATRTTPAKSSAAATASIRAARSTGTGAVIGGRSEARRQDALEVEAEQRVRGQERDRAEHPHPPRLRAVEREPPRAADDRDDEPDPDQGEPRLLRSRQVVDLGTRLGDPRLRGLAGRRALRRVERGLDDEPLPRRVLRIARRERERGARRLVEHLGLLRCDDQLLGHRIPVGAGEGLDRDLVAGGELVEAVERRAVGRAVTGDRGVAELTRHGRVGVVAGSLAQVGHGDALDHGRVDADLRDADHRDRLAVGRRWEGEGGRGGTRDGLGRVPGVGALLVEVAAERATAGRLVDARAPQLLGHEQQDQQADRDEDPPEGVDSTAHPATVAVAPGGVGAGFDRFPGSSVHFAALDPPHPMGLRRLGVSLVVRLRSPSACSVASRPSPGSTSTSRPARSCSSPARTARARRRCCGSSPASCSPYSGEGEVLGHDLFTDRRAARRGIALVGHETFCYDDLTAAENLRFFARAGGIRDDGPVRTALDRVGARERRPTSCTGACRRGSAAGSPSPSRSRANPALLLLDEPHAGLDADRPGRARRGRRGRAGRGPHGRDRLARARGRPRARHPRGRVDGGRVVADAPLAAPTPDAGPETGVPA